MSEVVQAPFARGDSSAFGPEDIAQLAAGLETALTNLGIEDRNEPLTNSVAKIIILLAKEGERDPAHLAKRAIEIVRGSN
jgi:hypothetical protein